MHHADASFVGLTDWGLRMRAARTRYASNHIAESNLQPAFRALQTSAWRDSHAARCPGLAVVLMHCTGPGASASQSQIFFLQLTTQCDVLLFKFAFTATGQPVQSGSVSPPPALIAYGTPLCQLPLLPYLGGYLQSCATLLHIPGPLVDSINSAVLNTACCSKGPSHI